MTDETFNLMAADEIRSYSYHEVFARLFALMDDEDELKARRALDAYYFGYNIPSGMSPETEQALIAMLRVANELNK